MTTFISQETARKLYIAEPGTSSGIPAAWAVSRHSGRSPLSPPELPQRTGALVFRSLPKALAPRRGNVPARTQARVPTRQGGRADDLAAPEAVYLKQVAERRLALRRPPANFAAAAAALASSTLKSLLISHLPRTPFRFFLSVAATFLSASVISSHLGDKALRPRHHSGSVAVLHAAFRAAENKKCRRSVAAPSKVSLSPVPSNRLESLEQTRP